EVGDGGLVVAHIGEEFEGGGGHAGQPGQGVQEHARTGTDGIDLGSAARGEHEGLGAAEPSQRGEQRGEPVAANRELFEEWERGPAVGDPRHDQSTHRQLPMVSGRAVRPMEGRAVQRTYGELCPQTAFPCGLVRGWALVWLASTQPVYGRDLLKIFWIARDRPRRTRASWRAAARAARVAASGRSGPPRRSRSSTASACGWASPVTTTTVSHASPVAWVTGSMGTAPSERAGRATHGSAGQGWTGTSIERRSAVTASRRWGSATSTASASPMSAGVSTGER